MNKSDSLKKLNSTASRGIFDYVIIVILIINLIYFLLSSLLSGFPFVVSLLGYICTPISVILGVYLYGRVEKYNFFSELKLKKCSLRVWIAGLLITFGTLFGLSELNNIFLSFLQKFGYNAPPITLPEKSVLNVSMVIIFVCLTPAIFEEILMRGLITKGLIGAGKVFAVLVSGAMFSLFHMSPQQTIYQFIVGVLYSLIIVSGGDYIITLTSHFINNLFIVLNEYFWKFNPSFELKTTLLILGLISLGVGVFLLLFKNKNKDANIDDMILMRKSFISKPSWGIIICIVFWVSNLVSYL